MELLRKKFTRREASGAGCFRVRERMQMLLDERDVFTEVLESCAHLQNPIYTDIVLSLREYLGGVYR